MTTEELKKDILEKSKMFFDSIESQLLYRKNHYWKFNTVRSISFLSILFTLFSIIPIVPLLLVNDFESITNTTITIWKYDLPLKNNYIRWGVFAFVSFILAFIMTKIEKKTNNLESKRSLKTRHLRFAYLYKTIKELNIFLINERIEHSEISESYLRKYFAINFVNYDLKLSNDDKTIDLPKTLIKIQESNAWLEFTNDSNQIINAFANKENLFIRINQRTEIDTLILILQDILCYEYVLLHKEKIEQNDSIKEDSFSIRMKFLLNASQKILELPTIENLTSNSEKTTSVNRLKIFFIKIGEFFTHENFFITFISWFLLLTLIFILSIFIGIRAFSIKIDTTIYIGVVSGIILGSITVAATLHSKKK